jgi:hypothetical protein
MDTGSLAAATHQYRQVLELCVRYIDDASTANRVRLVSRQHDALVLAHVQQQVCSLLEGTIVINMRHILKISTGCMSSCVDAAARPLEWLLRTAGPASVGAPAVAEALLHLSPSIHPALHHVVAGFAFKQGLKMPVQLLVDAAKQRSKEVEKWLRAAYHAGTNGSSFSSGSSSSSSHVPALFTKLGNSGHKVCMQLVTRTAVVR